MAKNVKVFKCTCEDHKKISYKEYRIKPFDKEYKKINDYFSFFLYDVEYWVNAQYILPEKWNEEYINILNQLNIENYNEYSENSQGKYKDMDLNEDELCFECQRICISLKSKEDSLSSLCRHIRNSIAHGQVYLHNNLNILFQDLDDKKHITARIIISVKSFEKLRNILNAKINNKDNKQKE